MSDYLGNEHECDWVVDTQVPGWHVVRCRYCPAKSVSAHGDGLHWRDGDTLEEAITEYTLYRVIEG
jgi:hypothetical protein